MATPDELREQLAEARAEFRAALSGAGSTWETEPAGGEGEEAWAPRQVAAHAIGAETFFTTAICKACGYDGVDPVQADCASADEAVRVFDEAVEACNKKLKYVSDTDLEKTNERFGNVENLFQVNITHMREHAEQIRAVGA
jgi:hypothetical protein